MYHKTRNVSPFHHIRGSFLWMTSKNLKYIRKTWYSRGVAMNAIRRPWVAALIVIKASVRIIFPSSNTRRVRKDRCIWPKRRSATSAVPKSILISGRCRAPHITSTIMCARVVDVMFVTNCTRGGKGSGPPSYAMACAGIAISISCAIAMRVPRFTPSVVSRDSRAGLLPSPQSPERSFSTFIPDLSPV